jgi:hypothetical protein
MGLKVMTKPEITTGQKFGRLTVEGVARQTRGKTFYRCKCECGTVKPVRKDHLLTSAVVSCGCKRKENQEIYKKRFAWGRA